VSDNWGKKHVCSKKSAENTCGGYFIIGGGKIPKRWGGEWKKSRCQDQGTLTKIKRKNNRTGENVLGGEHSRREKKGLTRFLNRTNKKSQKRKMWAGNFQKKKKKKKYARVSH